MAFSDDCFEWGTLNLMMGSIKIQFTPVLSDEIPQLGRNGACMDEIERMMLGLPEADLKRTVRTILRLVSLVLLHFFVKGFFVDRKFRKRGIQPTKHWFNSQAKKDELGQNIPILDLCSSTENLMMLPVLRDLRQREYELFSIHTLVDDSGFTMSFQIWRKPDQAASVRTVPLELSDLFALIDDAPAFQQLD